MKKEKILEQLCYYDRRNPDFNIKEEYGYSKEEVEATGNFSKQDCSCDNCFYGRSILANIILAKIAVIDFLCDIMKKEYDEIQNN